MQGDGNLVMYADTAKEQVIWATNTELLVKEARLSGPYRATMQDDGNFVVYAYADRVLWESDTAQLGKQAPPHDPPLLTSHVAALQ
jgi:hypothetical protein